MSSKTISILRGPLPLNFQDFLKICFFDYHLILCKINDFHNRFLIIITLQQIFYHFQEALKIFLPSNLFQGQKIQLHPSPDVIFLHLIFSSIYSLWHPHLSLIYCLEPSNPYFVTIFRLQWSQVFRNIECLIFVVLESLEHSQKKKKKTLLQSDFVFVNVCEFLWSCYRKINQN